jgi:hypothetical protein
MVIRPTICRSWAGQSRKAWASKRQTEYGQELTFPFDTTLPRVTVHTDVLPLDAIPPATGRTSIYYPEAPSNATSGGSPLMLPTSLRSRLKLQVPSTEPRRRS